MLWERVSSQVSSSTCQSTNERLYALHDVFSATAVVSTSRTLVERYRNGAYVTVRFMNGTFGSRSSSAYARETLYDDYRWDSESGLYQVRHRYLHPTLGTWVTRDPIALSSDRFLAPNASHARFKPRPVFDYE